MNSTNQRSNVIKDLSQQRHCCAVAIFIIVSLNFAVGYAGAQETLESGSDVFLEEIIVTAAKREQSLQKVALSVSAFGQAQLERAGIVNMEDLFARVPGVGFRSAGPGRGELNIRGISSKGGRAATVGFYVDETPIPVAGAEAGKIIIDPNFFDLDRVEVLRGPQGTLYGSSSLGGIVKIITNQPNLKEFEMAAATSVSSVKDGEIGYDFNGMLNLPLGDGKAALRLVGSYGQQPGYIDRLVVPGLTLDPATGDRVDIESTAVTERIEDVNRADVWSVRALLKFAPTERLTITPSIFLQRMEQDGQSGFDRPPGGERRQFQPINIPEPFDDEFDLYSLSATYDSDNFELQSSTSYFLREIEEIEDAAEDFGAAGLFPGLFIPATVFNSNELEDFSQELRLTSVSTSSFQWVLGLFYENSKDRFSITSVVDELAPVFGDSNLITIRLDSELEQLAAFGELSYQFTDRLQGAIGARWFDYDATFAATSTGILPNIGRGNPFDTLIVDQGGASNTGVSPKIALSYELSDDVLLYSSATKGFRPGAANVPIPPGICDADFAAIGLVREPFSYDPDDVWSYEIGAKSSWNDGRFIANGAAYHIQWNDIQQRVELSNCGFQFQDNLGEATSTGVELELVGKLGDGLQFSVSGGYTNAELTKDVLGGAAFDGQRVLNSPAYTISAALDYSRPVSDSFTGFVRVGYQYVGETVTNFQQPQEEKPSYDLVDLRVGLIGEKWEVTLFAKNLFDEESILDFRKPFGFGAAQFDSIVTTIPRTLGITAKVRY